ncbi:MAG TPA: hypothetical protein VK208_05715 [Pyrinomonadaceae bacterium]|jgi:hypothetical protein|nr:hypothetical protein [Pyrinomonadaceae bacterium]
MQSVYPVDPLNRIARLSVRPQMIDNVNAPDDQNTVFSLDLACDFCGQFPVTCVNLARLQRAPEGAGQSTGRPRYDIIYGSRVRLGDLRLHSVMPCNGPMYSELNRLGLGRQIGEAQWTGAPLDADP